METSLASTKIKLLVISYLCGFLSDTSVWPYILCTLNSFFLGLVVGVGIGVEVRVSSMVEVEVDVYT